jgi:acid phosphatase type 7
MKYAAALLAFVVAALVANTATAHHCKGRHASAPQCSPTPPPTPPTSSDPVVAIAGDIANSGSNDEATAKVLDAIQPTAVLTVGDNAYPDGTLSQFMSYYEPTWGRHNSRVRPTPGNHEYHTSGASGYFSYFGARAGDPGRGYYSYDVGDWHVIALNSNISRSVGSTQEQWLRQDLRAHLNKCTLAYWHHPRWTSGTHSNDTASDSFWRALYEYGADVVVGGHNHQYERFAPQDPAGQRDDLRGIRQFVAGTGGGGLYSIDGIEPNSEVRNTTSYGVLKLTLHPTSYDWKFEPIAGQTFSDAGLTSCH